MDLRVNMVGTKFPQKKGAKLSAKRMFHALPTSMYKNGFDVSSISTKFINI